MQSNDICEYCKHSGSIGNEWRNFCKHCRGYYDDETEMNFDGIEVTSIESLAKMLEFAYKSNMPCGDKNYECKEENCNNAGYNCWLNALKEGWSLE